MEKNKRKIFLPIIVVCVLLCALSLVLASCNDTPSVGADDPTDETPGEPSEETWVATPDLEYTLTEDFTGYLVSGIGTAMGSDIVITKAYKGKPVVGIGYRAFYNCTALTSIAIPNSVTNIDNSAFRYCASLTNFTVEKGNTKYHSAGNCLIETESKTLIAGGKNSAIPTDGSVTSIGDHAFSGCTGLTSIVVPNSITSVGEYAFKDCAGLTSITLPNSVTSIGDRAFYYCAGLASITIPNSVTNIGTYVFYKCTDLTSIHFDGTKAEWQAIEKGENWVYGAGDYTVYCADGNLTE